MDVDAAEKLDDFWKAITRCEEFICLYGHTPDPEWEQRRSEDLDNVYSDVTEILKVISEPRIIHDLPNGLNAFAADNYHDALIKLLNPPHRWFGHIGVLNSNEYINLKRLAEDEERLLADPNTENSVKSRLSPLTATPWRFELTEMEQSVLEVIGATPRQTKELERLLHTNPGNIGRHLSLLQRLELIERTPKGYRRL